MSREPLDPTCGVLCPSCAEVVSVPPPGPALHTMSYDHRGRAQSNVQRWVTCAECGCGAHLRVVEGFRYKSTMLNRPHQTTLQATWHVTHWAEDVVIGGLGAAALQWPGGPWRAVP